MRSSEGKAFGVLLGQFRTEAKLSQQQLANLIGKSRGTIVNWENGTYLPQGRALVLKLAEHLHLDPLKRDQLLQEAFYDPSGTIWTIPFQRNPFFTGREDILDILHRALSRDKTVALMQPQALKGLGGIGKTHMAIEYAYRHRDEYQAILWAPATSSSLLRTSLMSLATILNLPQKNESDQGVVINAVKQWLMNHSGWLLILDNVEDLKDVGMLYPWAHSGHVIITTRSQSVGGIALSISLEKMKPEEGASFLLHRTALIGPDEGKEQAQGTDYEKAKELSEVLDGLPLALDQAAAYIEKTKCGLSTYLTLYHTQRAKLLNERGSLTTDHPESVTITFSLAFQKVKDASMAAGELLQFCAFLSPDAIPEEIITEGGAYLGPTLETITTDLVEFNEAVGVLLAYSLVGRDTDIETGTQILSVHRLVQAVLRDAMEEKFKQQWSEAVLKAVDHVFPLGAFETWANCETLLPQVLACYTIMEESSITLQEGVNLLQRASGYLYMRGWYERAELLLKKALKISQKLENPTVMHNLFNTLSLTYWDQGKYKEAEELCLKVLNYQKQTGVEDLLTCAFLSNLALIYQSQGKMKEAEIKFQQALKVSQKVGDTEDESIEAATIMGNLGTLYCELGKYREAKPLLEKALAIRKKQLREDHPDIATSLHALGIFYNAQEMYESAEQLFQQALEISQKQLGEDHPDTADTGSYLGMLYKNTKKYDRAEPLLKKVLEVRRKSLGEEHSVTIDSYNMLIELYFEQNKYQEAIHLAKESMENRKKQLGEDHPEIATNLNDLGVLYCELGKYREAEPVLEKALAIRRRLLEEEHPYIIKSLNSLAVLYIGQGEIKKATPLVEEIIERKKKQLGEEHIEVTTNLNILATLYKVQGMDGKAEQLYQQILRIKRK